MPSGLRLPKFVTDYLWAYATGLAIAIATAVLLLIRRLPGWFRSVRAVSWPFTQGTIESVKVKTVSGQALGELAYSYEVNGERYSGYFLLQFADEQDAWERVDPLKGQQMFIRYQSANPAVSAVRKADQSPLFSKTHENLLGRILTRQILELLGWDWHQWTRLAAWNWPVAKGRVEHSTIGERGDAETWLLVLLYPVEVSYSYSVAGEYYSGTLERSFFRVSSAIEFVSSLRDRGVFVRYNQSTPSISVARDKDQVVSQSAQGQPVSNP